jgi:DNA-binding NarL/FixJ family response regulator
MKGQPAPHASVPTRPARRPAAVESLTGRERDIIRWICQGLTSRDIAVRLGSPEATARQELFTILDKLDLTDRFQLVVFAVRHRLTDEKDDEYKSGPH